MLGRIIVKSFGNFCQLGITRLVKHESYTSQESEWRTFSRCKRQTKKLTSHIKKKILKFHITAYYGHKKHYTVL